MEAYRKVKTYKIRFESFDSALKQMKFRRVRTTPFVAHYRREDGLHVTLSSRVHRKGRGSRKIKKELGKGSLTIVRVHKDTGFPHKATKLSLSERKKFLSELCFIARNLTEPNLKETPK